MTDNPTWFLHSVKFPWAEGRKLKQIQMVNQFELHIAQSRMRRWYIDRPEFKGMEVAFEKKSDAMLFKLALVEPDEE